MKKNIFLAGLLLLTCAPSFADDAAPAASRPVSPWLANASPWLKKQLKKDRYKCPPGKSPFRGAADAQVTIIEFVDYECPYCVQQEPALKRVLQTYPTQVKVVCKNLPLMDIHPTAKKRAVVAECMAEQGKFWQAHDRILAKEPAKKVRAGVDEEKLNACIAQGGDGQVDRDTALAKHLGMAGTPAFVIDGIRIGGSLSFNQLKQLIDAELVRKAAQAARKQNAIARDADEGTDAEGANLAPEGDTSGVDHPAGTSDGGSSARE